jgi:hypothetical protein
VFEHGDGVASESVQFADRQDHRPFEVVDEVAEVERGAAKAADLGAEAFGI